VLSEGAEKATDEPWHFAFYTYSHERYELSVFPDGDFLGPPEDALQASAAAYLT
jgi:hypothetical protein